MVLQDTRWDSGMRSRPIKDGKGGDSSWEDWGNVMMASINPPLIGINSIIKISNLGNTIEKQQVDYSCTLLNYIMNAVCSNRQYMLLSYQMKYEAIVEALNFIEKSNITDDNFDFVLNISDFPRAHEIPHTPGKIKAMRAYIVRQMDKLQNDMDRAIRIGNYYDTMDFRKFIATPIHERSGEIEEYLPPIGQDLIKILSITQHNTILAHLEAIASRQILERYGGISRENEKTRMLPPRSGDIVIDSTAHDPPR